MKKNTKRNLIIVFIVIALASFVTWQMAKLAEVECSLCITYKGQRQCSTALGPNPQEASDEAHRSACATLASGVTEVVACNQALRETQSCSRGPDR